MPRLSLALALAGCLLLPLPAAAATHEAEGRLHFPDGVALRGSLDLHGPGLLELVPPGGDAGLAVAFEGLAHGMIVDRMRDRVRLGLPGHDEASVWTPEEANDPVAARGPGRVENVRCGTRCQVAAIALPGEGTLGARGHADAAFTPTAQERVFSTARSPQNWSTQERFVVPAGSIEAEAGDFAGAAPWASGRVLVVLVDAVFDVVADDGTRTTLDARWWNETLQEAAGEPVLIRHHARHAALTFDGAAFAVAPGAPFRLSLPGGADARLEGILASDDASGTLAVGGHRHGLDREGVLLDGSLALRLTGAPPGLLDSGPPLDADVRGDVERATIAGASVLPWTPSVLAGAGGGLLALAGLAFLGRLAVPLYHRLAPADLLVNANRRRIYEAIRERPGADVGSIVAAVGLSRILVRHHLRMLEQHKLVRATVWRRRRTYALAGQGPGHALGLAACELKDATRRRVAGEVARSGGATQKDLTRALGLSQRLVSYHLARLGDSSLVRAEGRNPRVYVATEALLRALGNGDARAEALAPEAAAGGALARAMGSGLGKEGEGMAASAAAPA